MEALARTPPIGDDRDVSIPPDFLHSLVSAWEVFLLFAIPIGGGIPAGVLLAKSQGLTWVTMEVLYFISDVALALVFEPLLKLIIHAGKHNQFIGRVNEAMKKSTNKTIARYGVKPGPFMLVMISFGVDPMTGRGAALAAGHNFISGWAIAILGDMLFFTLMMFSIIWLNNILGDGTWTAIIIMVVFMGVPALVRKVRKPSEPVV